MNQKEYRAQVDAVPFSPDFQARTVARLAALAPKKETNVMTKKSLRTVLIAAAVAVALCATALAAAVLLTPRDVAQRAGNDALAAAFESDKAVRVNKTETVGDYHVTLMGLVSGDGLSQVDGVSRDKTYAVLAYARTDKAPIEDDVPELTVSPLVEGFAPWQVNAWTLGGNTYTFAEEGTLYYLFECDNVEPLADHTVYLAVYPGTHTPPSAELFSFDEATGVFAPQAGADVALFPLPLDKSKADPQAVQGLLDWMKDDGPVASEPPADEVPGDGSIRFTTDGESAEVTVNGQSVEPGERPGEFIIKDF